ncbi:hypothetical protein [Acidovorax delafieldii]|uniref:hypothetical protein n=1 Tax=Acidovorax delafieldii TaxID=47920 RepID=UPI003ECDBFF0
MALFQFGSFVATPAALAHCEKHKVNPLLLLGRHIRGDWGDLVSDDTHANLNALAYGDRIFSSYRVGDSKVWVITEADRSCTCLMLPEDY